MADTLRGGRFVLLGTLGEGAQGRTFDGVDKREGRPVAIKRFDVRGARAWKDVELAEREARVLQSLSHSKLPRYVDHFELDGALYLVMEKIEGESLANLRKRGAALGEAEVVRLLRDASDVLDYLHGRAPPVIHRDLKPGNVIRRPDGSFAFVDFGAVRDKLRAEGGSTVVGTFGYMAPEQFQGRALPSSDIYSIGATAVAMISGCEPEALPHRGLAIDVRAALRGRASERLIEALEKMLDPNPDRRASRLAPVLARLDARRNAAAPETYRDERSNEADRFASRRARKRARKAQRHARRRTRGARNAPWPLALLFMLTFSVGMLAVWLVTQVVVPIVLGVLSLVFARRALWAATQAVRDAGRVAMAGMAQSRRWFRGEHGDAPVPGVSDAEPAESADVRRVPAEPRTAPSRFRIDGGADDVAGPEDDAGGAEAGRTVKR